MLGLCLIGAAVVIVVVVIVVVVVVVDVVVRVFLSRWGVGCVLCVGWVSVVWVSVGGLGKFF